MTREAKVGLMMVAVLVGVFGFLVYKRIHRPSDLSAAQRVLDDTESVANDEDEDSKPRFGGLQVPDARRKTSQASRDFERVEQQAEEFVEDVVTFTRNKKRPAKPAVPQEIEAADEDFVQFENPRKSDSRPRKIAVPERDENPFEDAADSLKPPQIIPVGAEENGSDPFDDAPSSTTAQSTELETPNSPVAADQFSEEIVEERQESRFTARSSAQKPNSRTHARPAIPRTASTRPRVRNDRPRR